MLFGSFPIKISTRLFLSIGFVFTLAVFILLIAARDELRRWTMAEAEAKAQIILDHKLAARKFYHAELKPKLLELARPVLPDDFIESCWMSASYVNRRIDHYFGLISAVRYIDKDCTIDARNPENEADEYERGFIEDLNRDSNVNRKTQIRLFDGQPYFVLLSRGTAVEESCLRCHGSPDAAPVDLTNKYGRERGFSREPGKIVSAVSIGIPLKDSYGTAERFSLRLSGLFFAVFACLFLIQQLLMRRLFFGPMKKIHNKALEIADSDKHLGETIPKPPGKELADLTGAFNRMSESLKARVSERQAAEDALQKAQTLLESRVEERTAELSQAYETLKLEINEKIQFQEALISERDFVESLVNTAQAIILVLDGEGHIVRFNPYLESISGYRLDDVMGRDWFETFLPPEDRTRTREVFLRESPDFQKAKGYISPIRTRGGQVRQIEWYSDDLRSLDGSRIGLLSVGQDITERIRAEDALKRSEKRLRSLYSQLLKGQEEERRKISKEVHDSIGSPLAAIKIGLENTLMRSEKGRMEIESIRALTDLAQHAMRECRRIMSDLRPSVLDDYGIVATIKWFCDRFQTVNPDIRIDKNIEISEDQVPESLRIVLFRIVQEALNNAARHSGAETVTISLSKGEQIELSIHDNGCGFDMNSILATRGHDRGFGISNMKERTELSGGSFQIVTGTEGTTLYARWSF
jgi:PAS domain S-box-containing protein